MFSQHEYVEGKLHELGANRRLPTRTVQRRQRVSTPSVKPLARKTGGVLRRIGEGLEAWASPPPQRRPA